jgi:hypothetical protein
VEGLPALSRVLEREGRVRQGRQAEHEVVAEQDPGGQWRAREHRDLFAPHLPHHVVEEDEGRDRVEQIEQRGARREKLLEPDLPPRRRLARPLVGLCKVQALGAREDQEEVQEHGRQQEEADRPRVLHEDVDPPVGGRPQAADEEEQEEHAEQEENPRRALAGHAEENEEADEEEEKPDDHGVEVRPPAEPLRGELHRDDPGLPRGPLALRLRRAGAVAHEVVDLFADPVAAQLAGRPSSCRRCAFRSPRCTRRA